MGRPNSRPQLAEYAVQTLVMCGRQDGLPPLEHHEDCGHLSTMERPQAATALMRQWLTYD